MDGTEAPRRSILRSLILGLVILLVAVIAGVGGYMLGWDGGARNRGARLPVLGQAPSYVLTNQLGEKVSSRTFRGKIQVVTFLDPYCSDFCPLLAVNLANFSAQLCTAGLGDKVVFVAFNVNPWQTGITQMRAFLQEYGWNPRTAGLQFLAGSVAEIKRIVRQGFHVAFERVPRERGGEAAVSGAPGHLELALPNPLAEKARPRYDIIHNDAIEIVDGKGRIRRIFDQGTRVSDEQLMEVIQALASTTGS